MKTSSTIFFILIASLGLGACEVNNSSAQDKARFGTDVDQNPDDTHVEYTAARKVLMDSCISCHAKWQTFSESDFVAKKTQEKEPFIVPKDLANSQLYQRIKGVSTFGDMPDNSETLTAAQRQAIADWILVLEKQDVPPPPPPPPPDEAGKRFQAAQEIIATHCYKCHGTEAPGVELAGDFQILSEAQFLAYQTIELNPLVKAGDPNASELFFRLKGIFDKGDMPGKTENPALTPEQAEVLREWISKIGMQ